MRSVCLLTCCMLWLSFCTILFGVGVSVIILPQSDLCPLVTCLHLCLFLSLGVLFFCFVPSLFLLFALLYAYTHKKDDCGNVYFPLVHRPASPSGKKFRSKPQLARYLGNQMDLSSFDFRTGKMLMSKLNKNRQRLRYDNNNQNKVRQKRQTERRPPVPE